MLAGDATCIKSGNRKQAIGCVFFCRTNDRIPERRNWESACLIGNLYSASRFHLPLMEERTDRAVYTQFSWKKLRHVKGCKISLNKLCSGSKSFFKASGVFKPKRTMARHVPDFRSEPYSIWVFHVHSFTRAHIWVDTLRFSDLYFLLFSSGTEWPILHKQRGHLLPFHFLFGLQGTSLQEAYKLFCCPISDIFVLP